MNISKDLLDILINRIPGELSSLIQDIASQANQQHMNIYLVGGIVRDLILDRPNHDIDLVLEGEAVKFVQGLHPDKSLSTVFHNRFGTVKFKFKNFHIDIASARKEVYSKPGALPDVTFGTIEEDLFRRDFTINSMAVLISFDNHTELIDPFAGLVDLESGVIRILHDNSYKDDATRMFRAIRYEQRLNFSMESKTLKLIQRDIDMVDTISKDRIRNELMLFFDEDYPEKCISRSDELGLLRQVYSDLKYERWLNDVYRKARKRFKTPQLPHIYLYLLVYNLNLEQLDGFLSTYNFPRQQVIKMRQIINLKGELEMLSQAGQDNWSIFSILRKYELPVIQVNKLASGNDNAVKAIDLYLNKLRYIRPQLSGEDLIAIGIPSGEQIGKALNSLYIARINGKVVSREEEMELARKFIATAINKSPDK
jgi:tRNA nucleotidyltransferase (CCA-adding enzyme)